MPDKGGYRSTFEPAEQDRESDNVVGLVLAMELEPVVRAVAVVSRRLHASLDTVNSGHTDSPVKCARDTAGLAKLEHGYNRLLVYLVRVVMNQSTWCLDCFASEQRQAGCLRPILGTSQS